MTKVKQNQIIFTFISLAITFWLFSISDVKSANSGVVTLSTVVQPVIALSTPSSTYAFGDLISGVPQKGTTGISIGVTTASLLGYTVGVSDSASGTGSALLRETDSLTRIIDFIDGTTTVPASWSPGNSKGVGVTVYDATTNKESKWGTGSAYNSDYNKYAGVPETSTVIHNSPDYKTGTDYTYTAFIIDVDADQLGGAYSGDVTFTATASI